MSNIFLYLGRRDKSDIKILAKFNGNKQIPSRLSSNLREYNFNISENLINELSQTIHDSRLMWEPWIESAETFHDFRIALRKRGYRNIPMIDSPVLDTTKSKIFKISTVGLPQRNVMIQKSKN